MADPFDSGDAGWTPISPRLATARLLVGSLVTVAVLALVLAIVTSIVATTALSAWWLTLPVALAVLVVSWLAWWAPRNRRSWGYREQDEELVVRCGIAFRRVVSVPYGRMQFVDLQAGPLARRLGFTSVSLHTASTRTASTVPGVPHEEALRLRQRLTELGESRGAGL
ncbi:PH domain-containing protein [Aeromicrobium sp.]|uniref:PH domain-containing protein n=1 Tax=Aeromicrobium sp. TaxID=1871063 RepID=UPI0025C63498|nr:PH domain-containing protein [Aeromicrobium sp.]MCK5890707.1 PH domain-containing protein [Aeromicrobium sp.]